MKTNRISPLPVPLEAGIQDMIDKIFPGPLPSPNLYRIVAKNEALFRDLIESRFVGRTGLFDKKRLAPALRETIILRTCVAANNSYEFALHEETISLKMGLTEAQILDLKNDILSPDYWEEREIVLCQLVDSLVKKLSVDDALFQAVSSLYTEPELIEIVFIIGLYTGVAMTVALARPALDNYKDLSK